MRKIKTFLAEFFLTRGAYHLARSIYKEGLIVALRKSIRRLFSRTIITKKNVMVGNAEGIKFERNEVAIFEYLPLGKLKKTLGVHLHLYYQDLFGEMLSYLNNIPYYFDLYVSCPKGSNTYLIKRQGKKLNMVKEVVVKQVENKGRDIKPLFVDFAKEMANYDYILHIHTKKSLYSDRERVGWRQYSLDSLLGSEDIVMRIFSLFEQESKIGLVYPDNYEDVPYLAYTWLANEHGARQLFERLNMVFKGGIFSYPTGSFYFAKKEVLKPLFELNLSGDDFQEEHGQTDGTMAHLIERTLGFVAKAQGYDHGIIDYREGVFRRDFSMKAFRPYFAESIESVKKQLEDYKTISFDVFDTLITRCIMKPDDVFLLMERIIEKRYQLKLDYLKLRKEAERISNEKKGNHTNIFDIYEEMKNICEVDGQRIDEFRELEIRLELELCVPRRDVLTLFNGIKESGKQIILVSDMYLTASIIEKMLEKCGYQNVDDIWVSCERGLRKDQDTIWDVVFEKYGREGFIHIGDNPRSDWQTLVDRRVPTLYLMSGLDAFKLTSIYDVYEKKKTNSVMESLFCGTLVNAGVFNSPFALKGRAGGLVASDEIGVGIGVFGPLFYEFTRWLIRMTNEEEYLAFLSREGYLLKQIYDIVKGVKNVKRKGEIYFLSSRRAAGIAGSRTWEDIEEILNYRYNGKLLNLVKARLGLDLSDVLEDEDVVVDVMDDEVTQIGYIIEKLKPFEERILNQCEEERKAYFAYLEENIPREDWSKLAIIDVGYAGTIQYYLSKMLGEKLSGYYLSTAYDLGKTKPDKIGCPLYSMAVRGEPFFDAVWVTQLFLEAALSAPFGQFVRFDTTSGKAEAVYKAEGSKLSKGLQEVQEGILTFARQVSSIAKEMREEELEDQMKMAKEVYWAFMSEESFFSNTSEAFIVNDDYTMNSNLVFNVKERAWKKSKE